MLKLQGDPQGILRGSLYSVTPTLLPRWLRSRLSPCETSAGHEGVGKGQNFHCESKGQFFLSRRFNLVPRSVVEVVVVLVERCKTGSQFCQFVFCATRQPLEL